MVSVSPMFSVLGLLRYAECSPVLQAKKKSAKGAKEEIAGRKAAFSAAYRFDLI